MASTQYAPVVGCSHDVFLCILSLQDSRVITSSLEVISHVHFCTSRRSSKGPQQRGVDKASCQRQLVANRCHREMKLQSLAVQQVRFNDYFREIYLTNKKLLLHPLPLRVAKQTATEIRPVIDFANVRPN